MKAINDTFAGRVAIISGGLGDIGRAVALEFARHGAAVAVGDVRPPADAAELLGELRRHNIRARYDRVDVTDAARVREWVTAVEGDLGVADLVILNAAIVTVAGIGEVTPEQWSRELRVNLDGAFHLAQAAVLRLLRQKRPGRMVAIGSWAAAVPFAHIPAYCVAKAGLRMLCKCLALELAPHGILVNELSPGYVEAGLSQQVWEKNPGEREKAVRQVPTGKLIQPAEVARQVVALCHPDNQHMTGAVVLMDGGLSLRAGND